MIIIRLVYDFEGLDHKGKIGLNEEKRPQTSPNKSYE